MVQLDHNNKGKVVFGTNGQTSDSFRMDMDAANGHGQPGSGYCNNKLNWKYEKQELTLLVNVFVFDIY